MGRKSREHWERRERQLRDSAKGPGQEPMFDRNSSTRAAELEDQLTRLADGDAVFWASPDLPDSIRLSPETEDLLSRLAQKQGKTKSEVLRTAIRALAAKEAEDADRQTPYEAMSHLIGCATGGPRDLSARTGARFAELLRRGEAPR